MSYIRTYREKFVKSLELEHLYIHHTLMFVEYIESIGLGDKIVEINGQHLKESVKYYSERGAIHTVSTMNNHLNAVKKFFDFLFKEGIANNIFNLIPDYDSFKNEIVKECKLKPKSERRYLESDQIKELLNYFNTKPTKYSNMTMMSFFFKLTLLVPAKRKVIANLKIGDFTTEFDAVTINGYIIKLPRALSIDIKNCMNKNINNSQLFFERFCGCKYSENVFNTPFYYALKEIGYDVPKDKDTFSVECIRNTAIVNLAINGTNPYLIARLSGLSLGGLDNLLKKFEIDINEKGNINTILNHEISKFQYYQDI